LQAIATRPSRGIEAMDRLECLSNPAAMMEESIYD
jgi:hypothetical protein